MDVRNLCYFLGFFSLRRDYYRQAGQTIDQDQTMLKQYYKCLDYTLV